MPRLSEEQIKLAKDIDLLTYLQANDPGSIRKISDNRYVLKDHDSFVISNNKWFWNSQQIGGHTALDYLVKVKGIDFVEAVKLLTENISLTITASREITRPANEAEASQRSFSLPKAHTDNQLVTNYLRSRGISQENINRCIQEGILYESASHNCVFVGKDNGTPKFASERSTSENIKKDALGSDKRYSFNIPPKNTESEEKSNLAVFESPIDALSHSEIIKIAGTDWDGHRLSLSGTSPVALISFLERHPEIENIYLCLDNDKAGQEAVDRIVEILSNDERFHEIDITVAPPHIGKDYGESLQDILKLKKELQDEISTPIVLKGKTHNEKMKEITDKLENGIKRIFESGQYEVYLKTLSKFHSYSYNNCVLIALQKPNATHVAGYVSWQNNFKRTVKKGEKAIKIIAPSPYKVKKTDINDKGEKEEAEILISSFKITSVYDLSQTEGQALPKLGVDELAGSVDNYKYIFAATLKTSPVPVNFEKITTGAKGYFHLEEKRIAINKNMSELQNLKTLIHEIAHARIHNIDKSTSRDEARPDRRTREVESESIAYTVCKRYGLDTSDYSFGYIASWSGDKGIDKLKSSLETIRSEANSIITEIDKNLLIERVKEQGKAETNLSLPIPASSRRNQVAFSI